MSSLPAPPLQQSIGYERALTRLGVPTRRAGGVLMIRRRVAGLPVALISRFLDPIGRAQARDLPGGLLLLSPDQPMTHPSPGRAVRLTGAATVADLPLSTDPGVMLAAMHGKWRNRLRHAQRQRVQIQSGRMSADPGHWLLRANATQARARGYRGWPDALTCAFAAENPGDTVLFETRNRSAAMLFLRHGAGATYHIGYITEAGRKRSEHNLILWQAMQHLAEDGVRQIELGLLHDKTPGLTRFKLGSGAFPRTLGGTWAWSPSPLRRGRNF